MPFRKAPSMPPTRSSSSDSSPALPAGGPEMKAAVRQEIDAPLAALRAAMEHLADEHQGETPPLDVLDGALREIVRVGRNVNALIDFAVPPEVRPQDCNLEELVRATHRALPSHIRERVQLAIEGHREIVHTDGPMLSRCLGYLITANVSVTDEALLRVTTSGSSALFTLLCEVHAEHEVSLGVSTPDDASLVLVLAQRELQRLGGDVDTHLARSGALQVTVRLPLEPAPGGEE